MNLKSIRITLKPGIQINGGILYFLCPETENDISSTKNFAAHELKPMDKYHFELYYANAFSNTEW